MKIIVSTLAVAAFAMTPVAFAEGDAEGGESIKAVCEEALAAEGHEDLTICACLGEQAKGNPELEAHMVSLKDLDGIEARYEAANDAGKAAMDACMK